MFTIREIDSWNDQILPLYEAVGWSNYTQRPDMLRSAFRHSLCALGAWEGEKLLGLVRLAGDGFSCVLIQDLLVHPPFQRRGIASALMREALARYEQAYQIQLLTDDVEATRQFYGQLGFRPAAALGCVAFVRMPEAQ